MFILRLFGGLAMEGPDGPLSGRAAQKRRLALLALLATAPARTLTRDKLIGCLWTEADTEQARRLLSVGLYDIRKALGDDALLTPGDEVRLNPERVRTDVEEFEAALEAGDDARAVALYAGPFLDGVFVGDAPEFERWVDGERERFGRVWRGAVERLAAECSARGDRPGAVDAWRRLAVQDPFSAHVALGLMHALDAAGDRAAALQHARVHATLLREEFGAEPDPEVEALAEQLRTEPRAAEEAAPPAVTPPAEDSAPAAVIPAGVATEPAGAEPIAAEPVAADAAPLPAANLPASPPPHAVAPVRSRPRLSRRRLLVEHRLLMALLLAVVLLGGWWGVREIRSDAAEAAAPVSVAVLPFEDVSPEHNYEYFSDGLTEEIINGLSTVDGLRVTARTSAFVFKDSPADVREVGTRLGVSRVLEGSVRKAGERLRITARLVDVGSGYEVWSERYDRSAGDVFRVQDEIARAVVDALRPQLTSASPGPLVNTTTTDPEAYNLYLQGRFFWYQRTGEGFRQAVDFFQRAVARDPGYALAYTGLADVYGTLGSFDYGVLPPRQAFPRAEAAVSRALALDPNLAEAHTARANILFNYGWDWAGADREFRRAAELNPGYATAYHLYSLYLMAMGRTDESLAAVRRARELDPLSAVLRAALARHYYFARDWDRSIEEYRGAVAMDPELITARLGLGLAYEQAGRPAEAIAEYQTAQRLPGGSQPVVLALLGHAYGSTGRTAEARSLLQQLREQATERYVPAEYFALLHLGLGEEEAALDWLEKAYENRSGALVFLNTEPFLDPLRDHPRFVRLVDRVGLPSRPS